MYNKIEIRRYFNTEGVCNPKVHYMVRLDERLAQIRQRYIERGSYFVINRGRQYGKTTTLRALAEYLRPKYIVLSMDFQEIGMAEFGNEAVFSKAFSEILMKAYRISEKEDAEKICEPLQCFLRETEDITIREMFEQLSEICKNAPKPIVLVIDEVDSAGNYQVFLDFLALLRRYYLDRENTPTFHSVILAGVYDIKNLKLKIRPESGHQYNSPWNVAASFNLQMDFSEKQISGMLQEYEEDSHTNMDIEEVASVIYEYTAGYPYLVSAICKMMDEELRDCGMFADRKDIWSKNGVAYAVNLILKSNIPLFDSMIKQLDTFSGLREMMEEILYRGKQIPFSPAEKSINLGMMFGFLKEENGQVMVANRIFEMYLLNLFVSEESMKSEAFCYGQRDKNQFIKNGHAISLW